MPLKKLHAMLADLKTGYFEAGIENLFRQALSKRTFDRGCEMDQSFLQLLPKLSEWLKDSGHESRVDSAKLIFNEKNIR